MCCVRRRRADNWLDDAAVDVAVFPCKARRMAHCQPTVSGCRTAESMVGDGDFRVGRGEPTSQALEARAGAAEHRLQSR